MPAADKMRNYIIGIDFDNTIIDYDDVICGAAVEQGLIGSGICSTKNEVRDTVRRLPGGELAWQRLQAIAYGLRIDEAGPTAGVEKFLKLCQRHRVKVYIISHKTDYARAPGLPVNLREAAANWMREKGFFAADGIGLKRENVFFEPTREDKIERIKGLACTHFIDDLPETFLETSFPADVLKILYVPGGGSDALPPKTKVVQEWREISEYFFDDAN